MCLSCANNGVMKAGSPAGDLSVSRRLCRRKPRQGTVVLCQVLPLTSRCAIFTDQRELLLSTGPTVFPPAV